MKLEGTTTIFPVRELIELVAYSTTTGVLNVYGSSGTGSIYFREGRMVHAVHGALSGLEALTEIFIQRDANFSFVSDVRCDEETVWGDAHFLINSAEQLAARWYAIRRVVPSLELIPRLTIPRESLQRRLLPAQLALSQAIDGQTDLQQISEKLSWMPIDVCEVVAELIQDGLVELGDRRIDGGTGPSRGAPSQLRGRPGLFDRIVGRAEGLSYEGSLALGGQLPGA